LVLEFCAGGDLAGSMEELGCIQRVQVAVAISRGLKYLHTMSPPVIHRDVKTQVPLCIWYRGFLFVFVVFFGGAHFFFVCIRQNILVTVAEILPTQDMTLVVKVADFGTVREDNCHRKLSDLATSADNIQTHEMTKVIIGTTPCT
jgi:serine/threonine protein kinase